MDYADKVYEDIHSVACEWTDRRDFINGRLENFGSPSEEAILGHYDDRHEVNRYRTRGLPARKYSRDAVL